MRSLYGRFVIISVVIMCISSIMAFLLANLYYHVYLKPYNSEKILTYAKEVKDIYEKTNGPYKEEYLKSISKLGYSIYMVDNQKQGKRYGDGFKKINISEEITESVLNGNLYNGIEMYPKRLFSTGYFDNTVINSIGIPVNHNNNQYALFIRPNIGNQFGELRIFYAVMVGLIIIISLMLIAIATRFIVHPIRKFTYATKEIANGEYDLVLPEHRKDEIGMLAKSFRKMAQKLKSSDKMRQEFVSNVSHEFQSPLSSIQGFSQTLQTENLSLTERNYYLEIIESESRRMSNLCKQLLTLASLDQEELTLHKEFYDLGTQIRNIILMFEWEWREKDFAVELDIPSMQIYGDANLLHQVWTNLFTNSIKFTENGGTISFVGEETEKEWRISISDTGNGIEEEEIKKIFDRFYKIDTARDRKVNGSGLGLSIVKEIIELHDGIITVQSNKGVGTTFTIYLPKNKADLI
ncbi:HAMP domain-containing histidine kinase (plasmid) [Bacillus cereus]|uniref:Heme sensor protein HssS n=1 Tax=Bacillus cereus TaxID=1396 RepID=A0AB73USX3_BACCE|nr:HAMP domain-containing sensor histidine kinase [Bacillus cereus]QHV08037.1 sensor histidine kinase [Bacillus cereus]QHV47498.1 HAMP domain-containing histidine kinase [Bacillus cereus]